MANIRDIDGSLPQNGDAHHFVPMLTHDIGTNATTGTNEEKGTGVAVSFMPVAICGMACRLPGNIQSPQQLWDFILAGGDARTRVPQSRYRASSFYSPNKFPGTVITEHGYFLGEDVDLGALDTSVFPMPRAEVERLDPQQRILLEVARECIDDACETGWKGQNIGVYVGAYGQDWYDVFNREPLKHSGYQVTTTHDFMISERVSHEMDLRGPSMTIRTACSSSLVGLNEACLAIARGDCKSAIVGGTSIIMGPALATAMSEQGVFSPDGSCKTFSATANGYARGEGIVAIYIKPLSEAIRDGNPIRAVISGTATNFDGKTPTLTTPSASAQEGLIRRAYEVAGISDISRTALFECHGTGTSVGDPLECDAVAAVFGESGIYIASTKPNLGHTEGASGLTSLMKAVLALENRTIPPNIKSSPLNPKIPFEKARLAVAVQPIPWPVGRDERVSINSFGIGGTNAHTIVESAASFGASRMIERKQESEGPQLFLYSASTLQSLKKMISQYQDFLDQTPEALADIAYTLANRRQHFAYRSFVVATKDKIGMAASLPSLSEAGQAPFSLVMVFTGQGAQWPQMGRELLRSNPIFRQTIRTLDKYLLDREPTATWKLEEELLKPTRTSRVNEAEFSQPLCTAVQLALVDALSFIGIKPAAVVGHSSGEIAAAYTAGALTAEEAILVAFHRGKVTKMQKKPGAMAAVGLSWEEAEKHLVPGVVVACDNAHDSVTLSGDIEQLTMVLHNISSSHPDRPVTLLKVDRAYHSHHMADVGGEYRSTMTISGVVGSIPSIPFFSSVTGHLYPETIEDRFGPVYWQENLERPVRFREAISAVLNHSATNNPIFLEVGPHPALKGPVRQILTRAASKAPHQPTLVRRQNGMEAFLATVGKLYTYGFEIDFATLIPGSSISGLPSYPWHHPESYWYESRVSKEWRQREYPYHPLLGIKLPETTTHEPVWRNLLHLETVPWLCDHKIDDDLVYPFSAYIAMASEAIEQVHGTQESIRFRHTTVSNALLVNEDGPTELVTTFRRNRLTDSLDSEWWNFSISSHNGHLWTKHCSGEVQAQTRKLGGAACQPPEDLPRKVSSERWYSAVRRGGLAYGPHFTTLEEITSSTTLPSLAVAKLRNTWHGDESLYHLHPIILDSYFQILSLATRNGLPHTYRRLVASSIDSMTITRCSDDHLRIWSSAQLVANGAIGEGSCNAGSTTVLQVSGARTLMLGNADANGERISTPLTAQSEWVTHVDFGRLSLFVKPRRDDRSYSSSLEELISLAISFSKKLAAFKEVQGRHLTNYLAWLNQQDTTVLDALDMLELFSRIEDLVEQLGPSSAAPIAAAVSKICANLGSILSNPKKAFEILNDGDCLESLRRYMKEYDNSAFVRALGHMKPNLRILELNAGTGTATREILKHLTHAEGHALYSQYMFADPSMGKVNAAKDRFKGVKNIEYTVLDISKSLVDQGFEDRQFDLIILTGVLHSSPRIQESLEDVLKLLSPEGRLLIQEPQPGLLWSKFILGILPGWCGESEDDRAEEPYLSSAKWEAELIAAGLEIPDGSILDFPESTVIVAKPRPGRTAVKKVTLLYDDKSGEVSVLVRELEARGYSIHHCTLEEAPPHGQDVIALLDLKKPFFADIDKGSFELFKAFVDNLNDIGMFWVTQSSQTGCQNPHYGLVVGLARTIRSEMAVDFATCEVDASVLTAEVGAMVDVFQNFQLRESGDLSPDLEYSIFGGVTRVNRIFPSSFDITSPSSRPSEASLSIDRIGHLSSLHWSEQNAAAPQGDEVEVEVHATGLNFRDILVSMGIIDLPKLMFGYEAAGVVRRVGPGVTKLRVGDRAVLMGVNTFSTVVKATELLYERIPDEMSFVDAAAIPLVFTTAIYSLIDVGRLTRGKSVLIHSAAGGVGLAAIQVAQMLGADIFTTVSNNEKAEYLMETLCIPRSRIFDSRNSTFVDDLMRETEGKGVDVALNSLSGELLHSTWRCIAKWGTMVEIGKRDLLGCGKLDMEVFLQNRNYCCVDIDQMVRERPEVADRLLRSMMQYFHFGHLRPIRLARVSSAVAIQETFQYMQQGKHIGKIVVELRDSTGELRLGNVESGRRPTVKFDNSASYLLVGGLGGLGRSVSIWMVQRGARNLTFLSRHAGQSQRDRDFFHEIESMGCTIQLVQGSVANPADVAKAVDGTLTPLKGIIQMSMVLRDEAFPRMSIDDWTQVLEPKVQGTHNLHEITRMRGVDLEFFVLFSSLSGIVGQTGQANYASANTFLDAFVKYRRSMHLPCAAIDLGVMEGVGYLTENVELLRKMQGTGWRAIQEEDLLGVLGMVIIASKNNQKQDLSNSSNIVDQNSFMLGISPAENTQLRRDPRMVVFHNISDQDGKPTTSPNGTLRSFLAQAKKDASILKSTDAVTLMATEIGKKLVGLLLKSDEDIDIRMNTNELGLDSMIAIEMRAWWKLMFGFDISVLEMLSMGTLEALGKKVVDGLLTLYGK